LLGFEARWGSRESKGFGTNATVRKRRCLFSWVITFTFIGASAQRTHLKPGWNMFSPQQDVELGKKAALDAARQLPSCNAPKVDAYLTQLGMRLASKLPTGACSTHSNFIA